MCILAMHCGQFTQSLQRIVGSHQRASLLIRSGILKDQSSTVHSPSFLRCLCVSVTMEHHKEAESHVDSDTNYSDAVEQSVSISAKDSTSADKDDMIRMGKRQETTRNFRHITILGFCTVILSIWENILSTAVFGLANGGTAGLIWGYLICMICFGFVTASLAEMASM